MTRSAERAITILSTLGVVGAAKAGTDYVDIGMGLHPAVCAVVAAVFGMIMVGCWTIGKRR